MSDEKLTLRELVSAECMTQIEQWVMKYPPDQKQSAVMGALLRVQDERAYLDIQTMDAVAAFLDMPRVAVYEVVSFYTMYERKPHGRNVINVCTSISCKLRDSDTIVGILESKLNVNLGETTADGRFTLRTVDCLGACVNAPMMQINKSYHENLTSETLDAVLEQYP